MYVKTNSFFLFVTLKLSESQFWQESQSFILARSDCALCLLGELIDIKWPLTLQGEYSLDFLQSKGGILMKTCEYIDDLKNANGKMAESLKETERLSVELEIHRQQVEELKNENALLRAQLQQHGVEPVQSVNS